MCLLRMAAPALEVEHRLPTKTGSGIQQNKTKQNNYVHMHRGKKNVAKEEYTN